MPRRRSVGGTGVGVSLVLLVLLVLPAAGAAPAQRPANGDYATVALNVLPPGQAGSLDFPRTASNQVPLYDGLTPLFGSVTDRDLRRYFKPARFGLGSEKPTKVVRPRGGLRILRDRYGVPHVYGRTRTDVTFGAGWVTAEDRSVFMELLRGPGRIAALDVPGINPFTTATSGREFVPTPQADAILARQLRLIRSTGVKGRQLVRDVEAYVAGINAYYRSIDLPITPWKPVDVVAVGALLGANLGVGGGDETRRSLFLSALQRQLGADQGRAVWNDLRHQQDPETPVSVDGRFAYPATPPSPSGGVVLDDGTFAGAAGAAAARSTFSIAASNALLISARRSTTGRPLFVAGPQVGHYYPQILLELDLHGGGIDARGASFPGLSFYVLLGRGKDFAWSATSANSDIVDHYVETLCGDDLHYLYKGSCRQMETIDAGVLKGRPGEADRRITFRQTAHGPVLGYASVGSRVAISMRRSTRGRELLSALAFKDLNENKITSAETFYRAMNQLEFTFNWFYADDRDIAMFSSGRLPVRPSGVDGSLPTAGTGEFEWRGFVPLAGHVRGKNPRSGVILNWNNKPGRGFAASDDNWNFGSVQRVDLLATNIAGRRKHTLATVASAMNKAATQDLRAMRVLPSISAVLLTGPAPSVRANRMHELLVEWRVAGASRLDRDLDGKIDHPGAAIMDAAWPKLADAVMSPVLGPLVPRLAALNARDDNASGDGSSYFTGWYGVVDKDLRALLGSPTRGAFQTRFCGAGDLAGCRAALWAALEAAGAELTAQGADPASWRADATRERITYAFLGKSMRFANRPTFQQVMTFAAHRPRPRR